MRVCLWWALAARKHLTNNYHVGWMVDGRSKIDLFDLRCAHVANSNYLLNYYLRIYTNNTLIIH